MKFNEIVSVVVRLLGVYLFISVFQQIIALPGTTQNIELHAQDKSVTFYFAGTIGLLIVYLVLAYLCLKLPAKVATFLCPHGDREVSCNFSMGDVKKVLMSLLGTFILANSLSDVIYNALWIRTFKVLNYSAEVSIDYWHNLVASFVELGIGIALILLGRKPRKP